VYILYLYIYIYIYYIFYILLRLLLLLLLLLVLVSASLRSAYRAARTYGLFNNGDDRKTRPCTYTGHARISSSSAGIDYAPLDVYTTRRGSTLPKSSTISPKTIQPYMICIGINVRICFRTKNSLSLMTFLLLTACSPQLLLRLAQRGIYGD